MKLTKTMGVLIVLLICSTWCPNLARAQQISLDPATVLTRSSVALSGAIALTDLRLTGSGKWVAGATVASGAVSLASKGSGESRIDLPAGANVASELRNNNSGVPDGEIIRPDGTVVHIPLHNCLIAPAWLSPSEIIAWFQRSDAVVSYLGTEFVNGASVIHLHLQRSVSAKTAGTTQLLQKLTAMDLYLDAASFLPVSVRYAEHPEEDATRDIAVEIRFLDYRNTGGTMIPFHIQRLRQNSLNLDVAVTSAAVNSGIPDNLFALQ